MVPVQACPRAVLLPISQVVLVSLALIIAASATFAGGESPASKSEAWNHSAAAGAGHTAAGLPATVDGPSFSDPPSDQEMLVAAVLPQPLVPVGGASDAGENRALARALLHYQQSLQRGAMPDAVGPLTDFLRSHPLSRWRAALELNLGLIYRRTGHMSKALAAWQRSWDLSKHATEPKARAIADYAVGKLAEFEAYLGRMETLAPLLAEVKGRPMHGAGAANISNASQGLAEMRTRPQDAFRCGPMALDRICLLQKRTDGVMTLENSRSTTRGTSLVQVAELAHKVGLNYQMVYREPGAALIVPAVMHWKVGHFAALIKESGGLYRVEDPTFGENILVSRATLDEEGSGYFVVPAGPLPKGWRVASQQEGKSIWGRGFVSGLAKAAVGAILAFTKNCLGIGMTEANAQASTVSLALHDAPLSYRTPRGPPVSFELSYAHRDTEQPAIFTYTNFGPKWTSNWISYITDNSSTTGTADLYAPSGGIESYSFTGDTTPTGGRIYYPGLDDQALVTSLVSGGKTVGFTRELPDGSLQTFMRPLGSNQFFLSSIADPQGNLVTLTYDPFMRITTITDAAGEKTTLAYGLRGDKYKVTKVTDPFGRFATFTYNSDGQLASITDVLGITSSFTYLFDSGDFVKSLRTPYGTSTFTYGDSTTDFRLGTTVFLAMTDPLGQIQRIEFRQQAPGIADSDPLNTVPTGMATINSFLSFRNSFVWSPHQLALATLPDGEYDYTKARMIHWNHVGSFSIASGVPESIKEPLENRVWYNYPDQSASNRTGSSNLPTAIGRVLDDGSTQLQTFQYNPFGHVTQFTDPVGRQRTITYDTNGVDLLSVANTTGAANQLLLSATYNSQHEPLTVTDASGQVTQYKYNVAGQLLAKTDALKQTTNYAYGPTGLLLSVTQPATQPPVNTTTTIAYDGFNRVSATTDPLGYQLSLSYDAADRPITVTYPDLTTMQFTYKLLDVASATDRLKRTTNYNYDSLRRLTQVTDPLGRTTTLGYCDCGSVSTITDPKLNVTSLAYDLEERLITKTFADNTRNILTYERTTSRVKSTTDALGQITSYAYNLDDTPRSRAYANAVHTTAPVSFVWDPTFKRIVSMTDGTGKTIFAYNQITSPPRLGAGLLASISGPNGDTQSFAYDAVGRAGQVTVDGASSQYTFDPIGRVSAESNPLDTFNFSYMGASHLPLGIQSVAGLSSRYTYFGSQGDLRLKNITNTSHNGMPLSAFQYGYDAQGEVTSTTIQGQLPGTVKRTMTYDAAAQLIALSAAGGGSNYSFKYDAAANRTSETAGAVTTGFAYNNVNALTSPGPVSYDQGGEPLMLGKMTYQWDAASRLISVASGSTTMRFAYDGLGRRTRITRLLGIKVISDKLYFWCGPSLPCLEKDAVTHTITKRYFSEGVQVNNTQALYYARDSIGSIRQLVSAAGIVAASYDYDPYGVRTKLGGAQDSDFGFAGLFHESQSGLDLALFRPYEAHFARWLIRDPAGEIGGLNLYGYVANSPQTFVDPLGLCIGAPIAGLFGPLFGPLLGWFRAPSIAQAVARYGAAQGRLGVLLDYRGALKIGLDEASFATKAELAAAELSVDAQLEATLPLVTAAEAEITAAAAGIAEASAAAAATTVALPVAVFVAAAGVAYFIYQANKPPPPSPGMGTISG